MNVINDWQNKIAIHRVLWAAWQKYFQKQRRKKKLLGYDVTRFSIQNELTAKTRKGITSIIMRVDFIPMALKNPTDPTTDSITTTTPDRPSSTYKK